MDTFATKDQRLGNYHMKGIKYRLSLNVKLPFHGAGTSA